MTENSSPPPPFLSRTSGNSRALLWCLWAAEFAGSYAEWNITVALFELPTNPPPGYTLTRDYLSLSIGLLRCEPRRRSSRFSKKFVARTFARLSLSRAVKFLYLFSFSFKCIWVRRIFDSNLYKRINEDSRKETNNERIWIFQIKKNRGEQISEFGSLCTK